MKTLSLIAAGASLLLAAAAFAETAEPQAPAAGQPPATTPGAAAPQLSDNPKMQAEGKRLAALMEKLQKESDPEERRKIMSEAMCPQ